MKTKMLRQMRKAFSLLATIVMVSSVAIPVSAADETKDKLECGVVVLASNTDGKISFVAMATKSAVEKGIHSGNIIKEITPIADGRGGGKPDMAQGGGNDASKIDNALAFVDEVIRKQLGL